MTKFGNVVLKQSISSPLHGKKPLFFGLYSNQAVEIGHEHASLGPLAPICQATLFCKHLHWTWGCRHIQWIQGPGTRLNVVAVSSIYWVHEQPCAQCRQLNKRVLRVLGAEGLVFALLCDTTLHAPMLFKSHLNRGCENILWLGEWTIRKLNLRTRSKPAKTIGKCHEPEQP